MTPQSQQTREEWKDIPGFEGRYQISTLGRVKSLRSKNGRPAGYIKKQAFNVYGYPWVYLWSGEHYKNKVIHRLVAEAFIPNPNNYPQVNHIDGDKTNYSIENLEWCTLLENRQHAARTGLSSHGETHLSARLTLEQVKRIKEEHFEGKSYSFLGRKYGVHSETIGKICRGTNWKTAIALTKPKGEHEK